MQEAIDLGRVYHEDGLVHVERGIPEKVALDLAGDGHRVIRRSEAGNRDDGPIGAANMIMIDWEKGVPLEARIPEPMVVRSDFE